MAGKGGLEDTEMVMENSLGDNTWITSLVQWLSEMRLGLRSNGRRKPPEMATVNKSKTEKIEMNKRGIVTQSETDEGNEGERIRIRVGQCWKRGKEIIEIVGLGDETAEVIVWEGNKIEVGRRVKVNKRNKYEGYTTGMGGRKVMRRETIGEEGVLVELSKDYVRGREMTCSIAAMRKRTLEVGERIRGRGITNNKNTMDVNCCDGEDELGWMKWKGKKITRMYTDGSHKEEKNTKVHVARGP